MQITKPIILAAALAAFFSCSDEGDVVTPSYTDGAHFIDYDPAENYKGSHDVLLERSSAITLSKVQGVQPTDEFIARNRQNGERTYLKWGYKYAGIQGDADGYYQRVYYNDTILIGLGFADNWQVADYDLQLLRGQSTQTLDQFNFMLLSDIETDDSKVQGGVFNVKARGWDDPGTGTAIDSIEIVEASTGSVVQKMASTCRGDGTQFEMITFTRDGLLSGDYELWLARWQYGLRQKFGEFSYYNYAFIESDPMEQDAQGNYLLKFSLKEIPESGSFTVTTSRPANYYVDQNIPFDPECYDAASQVYTYTLIPECWRRDPEPGTQFAVSLNLNGVRTNVSGTATLPATLD